jgi:hypothetical protein
MNKSIHRIYIGTFFAIGIASTLFLAVYGFPYYTTSLEERFFLIQDPSLKPSGIIGHGVGILGSIMMIIGVAFYMIRKRGRRFQSLGILKYWLEFHIFLCTVGPILILFHTAFKFGGIVSVSFWCMVAVVLSGVIGRFIYLQIPHSISGQELTMNDLNDITLELDNKLRMETTVTNSLLLEIEDAFKPELYLRMPFVAGAFYAIKGHLKSRKILKRLRAGLKVSGEAKPHMREIMETARSKTVILRRIGLLKTMQKIFRYWHIVHLPFAIVMFVIMFIHVAVTIAFGAKWIF